MKKGFWKKVQRLLAAVVSLCLLVTSSNLNVFADTNETTQSPKRMEAIADVGTAYTFESMLGHREDGNRYAGRLWVDKSVYTDGQTAVLNTTDSEGEKFEVALQDDEDFQVIFSVLGSSMTTTTTTTEAGAVDVVLVLDNSSSMNETKNRVTRMERVITAANSLISDLLASSDVRLGIVAYGRIAEEVVELDKHTNGLELSVNNYNSGGRIIAKDNSGREINRTTEGYQNNTNTQAGFDMAMEMLEDADNKTGRAPVVILLTDGAANTAVTKDFYNVSQTNARQIYYSNNIDPTIVLSTLLSSAYKKASVEDKYGKAPMVYGVGVDLSSSDGSNSIINPKESFNASNSNTNVREAYDWYTNRWLKGETVQETVNRIQFTFDHNYPSGSGITDADVAANINYVDKYYDVSDSNDVDIESVFSQIYDELKSSAFNPITTGSTQIGGTGSNTPLIYVDRIGKYMEIKSMQAVTLFGQSYGITDNGDGTYSVQAATGTNPTTNEVWDTSQHIKIKVVEDNGDAKLEVRINQQILPILLEQVEDNIVEGTSTATIEEILQRPLRVYYTVGLKNDILLPNGDIDLRKIDASYLAKHYDETKGTISFYSNQFGVMNTNDTDNDGYVDYGDAHVGFKPSTLNRYYYHQANQGVYTSISYKDGSEIEWEDGMYGVLYEEGKFDFTQLSYEEIRDLNDDLEEGRDADVYTYVSFYRPKTNSGTAAEKVSYVVYTKWSYLKDSIALFDANTNKYINYDKDSGTYVTGDVGYTMSTDKLAGARTAYPNANIKVMLGVGSMRTSRFHNMIVNKVENETGTATTRYVPEYTLETAQDHSGNDVVVWLGNNGRLDVKVDTGIALTKAVTEAIGNPDDVYKLTVTVPADVKDTYVIWDAHGNNVTKTVSESKTEGSNTILTVNLKAGETVYIGGIPGGTVCTIGENIPDGAPYQIQGLKTFNVTVPRVEDVVNATNPVQFVDATVTNTPIKYGDLTIIKDIQHNLTEVPAQMEQKVFTFEVKLTGIANGTEFAVDKKNASLFTADKAKVENGKITIQLKDNESLTIIGVPENTEYTVKETGTVAGYRNTTGIVDGTIIANEDNDAHFINTYTTTPIAPTITVTGTKTVTSKDASYAGSEEFTFVLSQYVGVSNENPEGYEVLDTATAGKGGTYTFNMDSLLAGNELDIGDHYFRVTEQAGTTPGMVYDATRGLFSIHVTDTDADGELEYSIQNYANTTVNGDTVTKNFTNIYDVEKTYVDININKKLNNDTGVEIPMDIFKFNLVNTKNVNEKYTVTTDASGKATIRIPNLDQTGSPYTYTLTEVQGEMDGMDYDQATYTVEITVTENGGQLVAVAEIQNATTTNSDNTLDVVFTNKYELESVPYQITGTKTLQGRAPQDGEFQFELYETDSSFALTNEAKQNKKTTENVGNTFSFSEITYTRVGTYYYSIKETPGSLAGVTYDHTHYHVTVTVGIDSANKEKLKVTSVSINKIGANSDNSGKVVFVNTYTPSPVEYTFSGDKDLSGRALKNKEFEFGLYKKGETTPIQTVKNKLDGSFTFEPITYTKADVYEYEIKELNNNVSGINYDTTSYDVTVTVTDNTAGKLEATAEAKRGNELVTDIQFENSYTAAPVEVVFEGTKRLDGRELSEKMFDFKLYETDRTFDISNKTALESVQNDKDGAFTFEEQVFNTVGTHYYVIVEDATASPIADVVYDGTQHHFEVLVTDIGDGQLRARVVNLKTGKSVLASTVDGKFRATASVGFENATFDEVVKKEISGESSNKTIVDGQKVKEGDILKYSITYKNYTGKDVVVDINDKIPQNTTYVDGSASHAGTHVGGQVQWILNVAPDDEVVVSFEVKVNKTDAIVTNTAVVRDGVNSYTTNEVVNHTVENPAKKEVFLAEDNTVSIDGKRVEAGDEILYEVSYINASSKEVGIKITDTIPKHTTYVNGSANNGGVYKNGAIAWDIKDVPAWSSITVSFKVTVDATDEAVTISNEAKIVEGKNDYTTNKVTSYTEDPVKAITPELTIEKLQSVNNGSKTNKEQEVVGNDIVTYYITVKNTTADADAKDVVITDLLPKGLEVVSGSITNDGVEKDGIITWNIDKLEGGKEIEVSFKVKVPEVAKAIPYKNIAKVSCDSDLDGTAETKESNGVVLNNKPVTDNKVLSPITGDTANIIMWVSLAFVSFAVCIKVLISNKKTRKA